MPQDYEGYVPADRPRRPLEGTVVAPHRGQTIMTLGILSLFIGHFVLGPMAWIMGRNDLREMDMGRMDPAGRDNTNIGTVCGMISTFLAVGGLLLSCVIIALCMGMGFLGAAATPRAPTPPPGRPRFQAAPAPDRTLGQNANRPAPTQRFDYARLDGNNVTICPHCD